MQSGSGDTLTKMCHSEKYKPSCNQIYIWRSNREEFISVTNKTLPKINVARNSISLEGRIIKASATTVSRLFCSHVATSTCRCFI
nr:unnamed protein product [Callosobruchus chinensis]